MDKLLLLGALCGAKSRVFSVKNRVSELRHKECPVVKAWSGSQVQANLPVREEDHVGTAGQAQTAGPVV